MSLQHRNKAVLVEREHFSRPSESDVLLKQVRQHNEAFSGRGLKFLRSFLSNIGKSPDWGMSKDMLYLINGSNPEDVVRLVKPWLAAVQPTPHRQFVVSQAALFVKKYPFPAQIELATKNGTLKFLRGERRNRHMNALTRARLRSDPYSGPHIENMRSWIRRLLGDAPGWKGIVEKTGWGPGANVGVNGQFTNFGRKFLAEEWTVTRAALPYVLTAAKRSPMFWELLGMEKTYVLGQDTHRVVCVDSDEFERRFLARVRYVDHNVIAFVPKDADEFRTIAAEPLLNSWIQKGIDETMRLRLRRVGLDLRHQEPNQVMAREGSLMGYNPYTTVDLSNASGSIYTELCRLLLPNDWFIALNATRSPAYRFPGTDESVKYHGFMSMGNGFCFPLQTAIFAAICSAAHAYSGTPEDFRVYGDDIIVRQNESLVVLEILRHLGFKANLDKTFIFGPFRESCGADWHTGEDVRPIYLDTSLDTIEERIRIHNAFCRLPNLWGPVLAQACQDWFPPFMSKFVRPFAADTDEAIDGRYLHWTYPWPMVSKNFGSPAWYGLSFSSYKDGDIEVHANYNIALMYAALRGASSDVPFAARRETRMRVARFSHSGNTSNWLPMPETRFAGGSALIGHCFAEYSRWHTERRQGRGGPLAVV